MLVAVQLSVPGSYLPPVLKWLRALPPQTIISLPVQTAVCSYRAAGALVVLVAVQLSVLRIVSPAGIQRASPSYPPQTIISLPVQTAVCCASCRRRVGRAGRCPTICAGIVSPAGVQMCRSRHSAPDDHFAAGPDCRVLISGSGRVGGAGGCPTVGAGIVLPPVFKDWTAVIRPRRSFRCRSTLPCDRFGQKARWWCWWLSNCRCWDCIFRRCSKAATPLPPQTIISLPVQTAV